MVATPLPSAGARKTPVPGSAPASARGTPLPPSSARKSAHPEKKKRKKKKSQRKIIEEQRDYEFVTRQRKETGQFLKSVLRFFLSNVGLIVVAIVVAIGGANLYIGMEEAYEGRQKDAKIKRAKEVEEAAKYLTGAFWWYVKDVDTYNFTQAQFENRTSIDLHDFVNYINKAITETKYDGTIDGWTQSWTTPNAILFTVSIMTVVGYGNIGPKTIDAQLFTIPYSLIAISSMMVMLKKVGNAMANAIIYLYSRCCCRPFRSKRLDSEVPSRTLRKKFKKRLIDEEIGDEPYMPTDRISVPMIVSICVIFGYVFLGAMVREQYYASLSNL